MSKSQNLWFRLDTDFRKDEKFVRLKQKYGREIACLYIEIIACMYEQPNGDLKRKAYIFDLLADECGATIGQVEETIKASIDVGLLLRDNDSDVWYSRRVRYEIEKSREISAANSRRGQAGAAKRWGKENAQSNARSNASTNAPSKGTPQISKKSHAQSNARSNSHNITEHSYPPTGDNEYVEVRKSGGSAPNGPPSWVEKFKDGPLPEEDLIDVAETEGPLDFNSHPKHSYEYFSWAYPMYQGTREVPKRCYEIWGSLWPEEKKAAFMNISKFIEQFELCSMLDYLEGKFWTNVQQ